MIDISPHRPSSIRLLVAVVDQDDQTLETFSTERFVYDEGGSIDFSYIMGATYVNPSETVH